MKEQGPARGLWGEIALALSLISIATILLNAGVFWLLLKSSDSGRRIELAQTLVETMATQLEVEAGREKDNRSYRKILKAYADGGPTLEELYFVSPDGSVLVSVVGQGEAESDEGIRTALFGKKSHAEVDGSLWGERAVVATAPVAPQGNVVGAVRIRMPLTSPVVPGGMTGFVLAYTLSSGLAISVFGFSLFRRRLLKPIQEIQQGTYAIASGQFDQRLYVEGSRELKHLCESLNQLAQSLGEYRDRTESHVQEVEAASEELRKTQEALIRSERLAGLGRMAAGLAHEVGNPLAAVLGYMELLGQDLQDPELERDLIVRSRQELERIHEVIRGLLDHAHPGSDELTSVDLLEAVHQAVLRVQPQASFQDVSFEVIGNGSLWIRIVPAKLQQVLLNLMLNAVDAMNGQTQKTIRWTVSAVDDGVQMQCEDTGPGFLDWRSSGFELFLPPKTWVKTG